MLTKKDPAYQSDLGYALLVLGVVLLNLRRLFRQMGIPSYELEYRSATVLGRSVDIFEGYAASDPESFEPLLADSLRLLAQARSGPFRQAAELAERAVQISERLAAANPAAFEPLLVQSLLIFSSELKRNRRDEALGTAVKAVEISRRLNQSNASAFSYLYADSLISLGDMQQEFWLRIDLIATIREAEELLGRWGGANQARFSNLLDSVQSWKSWQAGNQ